MGNKANHIKKLRREHDALEEQINTAHQQPSFCSAELSALKRQKLALKDEIVRLTAVAEPQPLAAELVTAGAESDAAVTQPTVVVAGANAAVLAALATDCDGVHVVEMDAALAGALPSGDEEKVREQLSRIA